jgi:transposase
MIVVGMDVHVRNSYLSVTDEAGQRLRRGRVGNTLGELAEFLAPFEGQPVRVSLENTTNARAIHRLLAAYGAEAGIDLTAQVLDARKLRIIAESVTKCDRLDADVLNELARSNLKLPSCYLPDDEVFGLREHLRARSDLVQVQTMIKNRIHALLHRRGILKPKGDLFTASGRAWLDQLELDEPGRSVLQRNWAMLEALQEVIKQSNRDLRGLERQPRWAEPAALLRTVPGVGQVTSLTVLAELGDLDRFQSPAAVSNYAGLVPVLRESNDNRYQGAITKRGPSHLRAVLVEAAWSAIRHVPRYAHQYDRIKQRRGAQKAIVAVARRMLEDMYVMLKKHQAFRYASPPAGGDAASRRQAEARLA